MSLIQSGYVFACQRTLDCIYLHRSYTLHYEIQYLVFRSTTKMEEWRSGIIVGACMEIVWRRRFEVWENLA